MVEPNKYIVIADPEPDPVAVMKLAQEEGMEFSLAYRATLAGNRDRAYQKLLQAMREGVDGRAILHDVLVLLCR